MAMPALLQHLLRNFPVILVAMGGLFSSALMYQVTADWDANRLHRLVESVAEVQTNAIEERLQAIADELPVLRGALELEREIAPAQFSRATPPLFDQHPMLYGLGWAPREAAVGGDRFTFAFHKLRPIGAIPPPLDLAEDMRLRDTLLVARDMGGLTASRPVLLQPDGLRGMLLMLPVYRSGRGTDNIEQRRAAFLGVLVAAIDIESLFEDTVGRLFWDQLDFVVRDNEPGGEVVHVHAPRPANLPTPSPDEIDARAPIEHTLLRLANRSWRLSSVATPAFMEQNATLRPRLALLLGLAITSVAVFNVYWLRRRHLYVESLVAEQTAALRLSEEQARDLSAELRIHRDHLQELVMLQTADIRTAMEAAESANQAKTEFLAKMSHELRTPMHAILSFACIGLLKADKVAPDKLLGYFQNIRTSCERLLEMVNDLLDLSKLEVGRMKYEMQRFDLRLCIDAIRDEMAPLLESKSLTCGIDVPAADCEMYGDPARLGQVLRNLVGNAIRFSPHGGRIEIVLADAPVTPALEAAGRPVLLLSVADRGVGIHDEELETIFDKFTQGSRPHPDGGGTGLGLAICREIVQAHQGLIRARNRPGGGAVFEVLLPGKESEE